MRAGVPTIKRPAKMMFMFFSLWVWNVGLNRLKYSQRGQNSPTLKTTVPFRCEKNSKLIPPTSVSGTDLLSCKFLVLDMSLARLRLDRRFSRPVPGLRDDGHRARKEHRVTVGDCLVRFRVTGNKKKHKDRHDWRFAPCASRFGILAPAKAGTFPNSHRILFLVRDVSYR